MKQSQLFTKTRWEDPADETSKNAKLLIRAGFIHKEMAGVYDYLPLGLKVLRKIENIIREEMNKIGGEEVLLTTLQSPDLWQKTDRWDENKVDNWFKTKLASGGDLGLANTHEEPITALLVHHLNSYKDFPKYIYQFQTKFRNELRAKSGIMRTREFLMKDLYSFSRNEEEFKEFYEKCATAYMNIFTRVGLGEVTFRTVASGGAFTSDFTDEFQTLSESGEDVIYVDKNKKIAINKEVYTDETLEKLDLNRSDLVEEKAIEVGNIFPLGTRYTDSLGLNFRDEDGLLHPVIMGSYGIGLGRLLGTIVEVLSDDGGIVWPKEVSPFSVHLVQIGISDEVKTASENLYQTLIKNNIEVLFDDREVSAGEKLADADLLGIPFRVVVSEKTLKAESFEIKKRASGEILHLNETELIELCQ